MKKALSLLGCASLLASLFVSAGASAAAADLTFDFSAGKAGWGSPGFLHTTTETDDSALKASNASGERIIVQAVLEETFAGADYDQIKLTIKNDSGAAGFYFCFGTAGEEYNDVDLEPNQVAIPLEASADEYKEYTINIGENAAWQAADDIGLLRLNFYAPGAGPAMPDNSSVHIRSITLTNSQGNAPAAAEEYEETFDENNGGWDKAGYLGDKITVTHDASGALKVTLNAPDRPIIQKPLESGAYLGGAEQNTLHLRVKNTAGYEHFFFCFSTTDTPDGAGLDAGENQIQMNLDPEKTDEYVDYYVNLAANASWTAAEGKVDYLRLIFGNAKEPGAEILIDSIHIYNRPAETEVDESYESGTGSWAPPFYAQSLVTVTNDNQALLLNSLIPYKLVMQSPTPFLLKGADLPYVYVELKNTAGAETMTFAFGTSAQESNDVDNDDHKITIKLDPEKTDEHLVYRIDLSENEAWNAAEDISLYRLVFSGANDGNVTGTGGISIKNFQVTASGDRDYYTPDEGGSADDGKDDITDTGVTPMLALIPVAALAAGAVVLTAKKRKS